MATLTRYTAKFYKDSTKTFYAVFISAQENPIKRVQESTHKYSYTVNIEILSDGSSKHTLVFPRTTSGSDVLLFAIDFKDDSRISTSGEVPSDSQILVAAHDSLSFFTTFSDFDSDSSSYSISDSIYYSKSPYNTLYIYPKSSVNYLDTSSTADSYYATAGGAAYIASNDLQNSFLIGIPYSVPGIDSNQLGRFAAGKGAQTLNFSQYTDVTQVGPVVHGYAYIDSQNVPDQGNVYSVSKNPASSNYYLNGCIDQELPCRSDGTAFSNDCKTGVALTSAILNDSSNIFKDGKCAESCDGYSLNVMHGGSASTLISADGTIRVEVVNGVADYTYSLAATDIGVGLSFSTVAGTSSIANIDFTGLYAGEYLLTITDSSSPTCSLRQIVYVRTLSGESSLKGCLQSAAINYDSTIDAADGWDSICVFCDSTGKLIKGADDAHGNVVGSFSSTSVQTSIATSVSTTGVSNTDGKVTIQKLKHSSYTIGRYVDPYSQEVISVQFNTGDYFTGGTDYEYKLYSLKNRPNSQYDVDSYLVANGTLIDTQSNVSGGLMQFSGLAASDYAVRISYTKDGAAEEYEDCYIIEQFSVLQGGCTDPKAENYNPDADKDDQSCRTPDDPGEDCNLYLGQHLTLTCLYPKYEVDLKINPNVVGNSAYGLVAYAGITDPSGNIANPGHCYYTVIINYADGTTLQLENASMTFNKLYAGTSIAEFDCTDASNTLSDITSVQLYFSHGGQWAPYWPDDTNYPIYQDGISNNQGPCGYSEISQISPLFNSQTNCCTVEPDPIVGCMDPAASNYNAAAEIACTDDCCTYDPIWGCTDANANNFDPLADTDDGSCAYDVYGCMDSTANNFDPNANLPNDSCTYDPTPCSLVMEVLEVFTDESLYAAATNTTSTYSNTSIACLPNNDGTLTISLPSAAIIAQEVTQVYWTATINSSAGYDWYGISWEGGVDAPSALLGILNASLVIADGELLSLSDTYTFSGLGPGLYNIMYGVHTNISSDGLTVIAPGTPTMGNVSNWFCNYFNIANVVLGADDCPGEPTFVLGCTDLNAINYNILANNDDGTCIYPEGGGCTDIFAVNYNPNVQVDDGSCNYEGSACAPPVIGTCVPNLYTENSADAVASCCIPTDISDRLDSIEKCLANSGSRFYNKMITGLSDSCSTMDAWKMMLILEILRQKGLPCVYNCSDAATQSLTGTTCNSVWVSQGSPVWTSAVEYQIGHVVKSPVDISSGNLNKYYVATTGVGLDLSPNTTVNNSDNPLSGWQRCCDEVTYSGNINYLTNFISFAEKYCQDCELPSQLQEAPTTIEVISNLSVGGVDIKNNGGSFEAS